MLVCLFRIMCRIHRIGYQYTCQRSQTWRCLHSLNASCYYYYYYYYHYYYYYFYYCSFQERGIVVINGSSIVINDIDDKGKLLATQFVVITVKDSTCSCSCKQFKLLEADKCSICIHCRYVLEYVYLDSALFICHP